MLACQAVVFEAGRPDRIESPPSLDSGVTDPKVFGSGGKGIRTPGLLIANETLYQLSYTPEIFEEAPFNVQTLVSISTGTPPVLPPW